MTTAGQIDLNLKSLRVVVDGEDVGTLASTPEGPLAFQYARSWLQNGYSISPLSLPLRDEVFVAKKDPLGGVFGVFNDSLPDGWGRLLVDRMLRQNGMDPVRVSPLARLAIVGKSGMGALEYEPEVTLASQAVFDDLDAIAAECAAVLKTDYSEDLDTLFALGGSSGGARPKILTEIDGQEWLVKFPSSHDPVDIGRQEYAIAIAAKACGIEVPEVKLLPSRVCAGYFAVKRFDRARDQCGGTVKVHMASAAALLETSHRIPNLDYDILMRLTARLAEDVEELQRMFKLMVFNVLVGNRDDHSKNFTFLYLPELDVWTLSPAYDLTRNVGINGEHATTVNGKGRNITKDDMLSLGKKAGLSARECSNWYELARDVVDDTLAGLEGRGLAG